MKINEKQFLKPLEAQLRFFDFLLIFLDFPGIPRGCPGTSQGFSFDFPDLLGFPGGPSWLLLDVPGFSQVFQRLSFTFLRFPWSFLGIAQDFPGIV